MKKFLFIGAMLFFTMQTFAQEWSSTLHKADELRGTKEYVSFMYEDKEKNTFIFWSHYKNDFRIICNEGIFDYDKNNSFVATFGYYDENGQLKKKQKITMFLESGNPKTASPGMFKKGEVVKYLKEGRGYIRILAKQFERVSLWEMKIPCMDK